VNVCPAIVNVPARAVLPPLAAMLKVTVPLPLPLAPLVSEIQAALLRAVHPHPADVVTLDEPVAPPAATV